MYIDKVIPEPCGILATLPVFSLLQDRALISLHVKRLINQTRLDATMF